MTSGIKPLGRGVGIVDFKIWRPITGSLCPLQWRLIYFSDARLWSVGERGVHCGLLWVSVCQGVTLFPSVEVDLLLRCSIVKCWGEGMHCGLLWVSVCQGVTLFPSVEVDLLLRCLIVEGWGEGCELLWVALYQGVALPWSSWPTAPVLRFLAAKVLLCPGPRLGARRGHRAAEHAAPGPAQHERQHVEAASRIPHPSAGAPAGQRGAGPDSGPVPPGDCLLPQRSRDSWRRPDWSSAAGAAARHAALHVRPGRQDASPGVRVPGAAVVQGRRRGRERGAGLVVSPRGLDSERGRRVHRGQVDLFRVLAQPCGPLHRQQRRGAQALRDFQLALGWCRTQEVVCATAGHHFTG